VTDAVPPDDFDAPFSPLPVNVVTERVKGNVTTATHIKKEAQDEWNRIFDDKHSDALIGDCFWYVICRVFNPGKYQDHEEKFLDRIAANYVSFTLLEDIKGILPKHKERFFKTFYDTIAQSVFYSLFFAYPKSRQMLTDDMKRKLLNIFSELYTGMEIKSAKFDHWQQGFGASSMIVTNAKKQAATKKETFLLTELEGSKIAK